MKMTFNEKTKMFEYRGYEIFPLERTNGTPASVIRSYYADERQRIDNLIEKEKYIKEHKEEYKNLHSAEEDINYFFDMINN